MIHRRPFAACAAATVVLATLAAWPAAATAQGGATPQAPVACPPLLRHSFARLQDGRPHALCQHAGQVLLIVNTASECGFTPQFESLQLLHRRYAARGLVVIGFPSDDFKQEADTPREIAEVCFNTYGVGFPMMRPTGVTGRRAHPLFAQLARLSGVEPGWNFHKYLVGRDGAVLASFYSNADPAGGEIVAAIETALAAGAAPTSATR